jgi:hypothetical protein
MKLVQFRLCGKRQTSFMPIKAEFSLIIRVNLATIMRLLLLDMAPRRKELTIGNCDFYV